VNQKLPDVVHDLAEEALGLALLMHEAQDAQWRPSLTPKPRGDTTERSKGGHSDPTGDTVADERRLAVRAQVIAAELLLESATRAMRVVNRRLERALAHWHAE
jgi:hypothetical protein